MLRWSSGYDACFTRRRSAVRSRHEVHFCSINPGSLLEPLHARKGFAVAAIAQLGERQTEDLEVPGSIPGLGIFVFATRIRCPQIENRSGFAVEQ